VVTFYTREFGKLEAVASGIGKPGSSLTGALELFTLSKLFFAKGRELERLSQAQVIEGFPSLAGNLRSYAYASWLVELTARATEPGEAAPELFDRLLTSLRLLAAGLDGALLTAAFALELAELLGVAPVLTECTVCAGELVGPAWYNAPAGGLVCAACHRDEPEVWELSAGHRALLQGLRTLPVDRLPNLRARPEETAAVLGLARRHLAYHLGFTLKSEAFLRQVEGD
jgi:DNA repair protein RecO (recombination protein O)